MKQSDLVPIPRRLDLASVLILALAVTLSCSREEDTGTTGDRVDPDVAAFLDDSALANASCNPPDTANTRARFVSWARGLEYRKIPRKARFRGFTPPSSTDSVYAEITSTARGPRELARGCVIGRIVSTYRDSAFGFIAGTTYIWADSSSPNSVHLVPEDGTTEMIGYNLATAPYVEGGDEPTIQAGTPSKHVCEQCGRNDWCVYPRDETRVVEPLPPDVTTTPTAEPD